MGAIKLKGFAKDGMLTVHVPDEFNEIELDVTIERVSEKELEDKEEWAYLSGSKRVEILQRFAGSGNYPDVATNKYDVYEQ